MGCNRVIVARGDVFATELVVDGVKVQVLDCIRPTARIAADGTLLRSTDTFDQDELVNHAGNVACPDFPAGADFAAGEVWLIDSWGAFNGGAAAKEISGSLAYAGGTIFEGTTEPCTNGHSVSLLQGNAIAIDAVVNSQINGGAATDTVSIHARRVA